MKVCQLLFSLLLLFGCTQISQAQCTFDVFVDSQGITCDGDCTDVFVNVQGGQGPYMYDFNGIPSTDPIITICEFGVYTVTVTDANGDACSVDFEVFGFDVPFVSIEGPDCLIPGNTSILEAFVDGGAPPYTFNWSNGTTTQEIPVTDPGTYCVTIFDSNGCFAEACYEAEAGGFIPEIEVVSGAICFNPDSLSTDCQKVCTNTVVTYQVTNANGAEVEWTIDGADDFEVNDDQVTVTWGEAGFGEVTATVGDPSDPTVNPLSVYCGQYIETSPDGVGAGYVFFEGGVAPFSYSINGVTSQSVNNGGLYIFEDLQVGDYFVTVTDATGNSVECGFFINDGGCFLNAYASVTPSTPNACTGAVDLTIVGSGPTGTEILWYGPNGNVFTGEDIDNLCCDETYYAEILDGQCSDSIEVFIPCGFPQTCGGETTLCVEILENPIAQFNTNPPANGGSVDVCKGQPIEFFNTSVGASTYIWDFGDFTNSVLENPIHTYPQSGTYEVNLIARNDCFCADTTTLIVNVSDLEIPEIECVGTVCKGETVTYETVDGCGSYSWTITGDATIIEGGTPTDNFITVEWNQGPEGTVELTVANCNPALCDATAVAVIPILTDDVSLIDGPDKVCPNDIVNYAITDFGGTEFTWSVSGGNILEGQGTNQITVEWTGSPLQNPHSVSINYENCFLNCGGSDQMDVNIRSEFYLAGPIEICQNDAGDYDAIDAGMMIGVNVNWTLLDDSGTTIQTAGPSSSTSFTFNVPVGTYTLQAVPQSLSGSCNVIYEIPVIVNALPVLPTAINGTDLICPGTAYTYMADGLPAHEFHWFINNGGVMTEDFGDQLNVIWGANPPYELQLSQIEVSGLQCESETISFSATAIPGFTLIGTEQICREQSGLYSADSFENIDYEWTIMPEDAGTIIDGEGTANVEIFWHSAGNHTVSLDVCGMNQTLAITVFDLPEPTAVFPTLLCPFEEGPVSTTVLYDAYEWRDEFGSVVSNDPNPGLIPGYYEVIVTDANGCTGNDIFKIEGLPQPNISISSPDILGLCPPSTITLYAIEITGGYDYQWFQDGVATGTNASTLDISDPGVYYTVVTDANGCTAQSNSLIFIDCATAGGTCVGGICLGGGGGNPGPGCTPAGVVDFTFNTTAECNIIGFQNTSVNYLPGSEVWNFRDFDSGAANSSTIMNPSHLFSKPGFFRVRLTVTLLDAMGMPCGNWWTEKAVMVPAAADFLTDQGCVGSPVQFNDHSAFLPAEITEITGWSWDFGDPASGAANTSTDQNPTHTYADDAFYTVTLTITTTEGCTSTVQKEVSVNQAPEITFLPPAINCQNTSLEFVLDYPADNNIVDVIWDFDDPTSGDANSSIQETTYHAYETPGDYDVVATATNIYGCTATYTTVVTVEPNTLTGTIDPPAPSPICEGDDIDLTASPGGSFWNWSTGETTETINVTAEGIYSVTVTNDDGCTYSPAPVLVKIIPAPIGTIQAVEYNEYEQPTGYFDSGYTVCEGEDVYLFTQTSADYTFSWSTGDPTQEISFTDDKGNLLPAGSHDFTVTITNTTTGCTSVAGPFEVIINPTPNDVMISSTSGGPLCDGSAATLSVDNPDAALTYVWNTGEQGTSITAFAAGEYFVRAINSFGCEGESNRISIENAPNINSVPTGCHFSCLPDTICLPNIPNIAAYQWYQDGVAIPAPEGTVADLIITESGSYTVEMTDIFGCTATSDPVVMTLVPGFGNIIGEVWFDVNENGVIDGADTLVSNMEIILIDNGMFLDTAVTSGIGFYGFANQISSNNYTLLFNTNNLPPTWNVYQASQNASLDGCDDETTIDFLLFDNCVSPPTTLTLETCVGEQIEYDGVMLSAGAVQDFTLQNQFQCDSIVTVTVDELPNYADNLTLNACQGSMVEYNGTMLNPGDVQDFVYQTFTGCDSTITVTVDEIVPSFSQVDLSVCKDETVTFMNLEFAAGTTQEFVFADQYGCDSTINLVVDAYPELTFDLTADEICFNATDGAIEVIDIQGGATGLEYSIDGLNYQSTALFENLQAGVYDVFVRDDNGCIYENAIEMPTIPALNISAENGIIDCADDGVKLEPIVTNANPTEVTWEWSDGSTEPTLFAREAGIYTYAVTNNCQMETGQIEVNWAQDGRIQFFFFPNVFSPNGDGTNDDFAAFLEQNVEVQKFSMHVFNRWGTLVFETDNYLDQWDGNYNGKRAEEGVYVVHLDATIVACGRQIQERLEGDVTVIR